MSSLPKLIVLSGHAGSGKDTVAALFIQNGYQNIKFSQPAKDFCSRFLGRPLDMGTDRQFVIDVSWFMKGVGVEEFRAKYGTKVTDQISQWLFELNVISPVTGVKAFTETFWCDLVASQLPPGGQFVFTDVRLPSEYRKVKEMGAKLVFLDCPQWLREQRLIARDGAIQEGIWENPFETHMDSFEYDLVTATGHIEFIAGEHEYYEYPPQKIYDKIVEGLNG